VPGMVTGGKRRKDFFRLCCWLSTMKTKMSSDLFVAARVSRTAMHNAMRESSISKGKLRSPDGVGVDEGEG
jgi:hypothetical protein